MIEELDDDFIRWLAQYLVMKRVSIEQNFQPLYNLFLLAIENRKLEEFVKLETFRNIKVLILINTVKNRIMDLKHGLFTDLFVVLKISATAFLIHGIIHLISCKCIVGVRHP